MKTLALLIASMFLVMSCSTSKIAQENGTCNKSIEASTDSSEYELIVMEPGFETWFITNKTPLWYHSCEYYEFWNRLFVSEWNQLYRAQTNSAFDEEIMYDPNIDYGVELNHKLFHYFIFFQEKHNFQLIDNKR